VAFLLALPLLAVIFRSPWPLTGYVIDLPAILIPVVTAAAARGETRRALLSLPSFFVLRTANAVFFVTALWRELILRRSFHVYEKGH
jgi:hypothetical protein